MIYQQQLGLNCKEKHQIKYILRVFHLTSNDHAFPDGQIHLQLIGVWKSIYVKSPLEAIFGACSTLSCFQSLDQTESDPRQTRETVKVEDTLHSQLNGIDKF